MTPAATIGADTAARAVLDAADALFYERGIAGVGMAEVRDAASVSMRRLYALHPSKRELVAAWLDDRHTRWMAWFAAELDRRTGAGADPVLAAFDTLDDWARSPGFRGCAFLNTLAEPTEIDESHRALIADHKRALVELLADSAAAAHPDAPWWLAESLGVLVDGAIVQAAMFGSTDPIAAARHAAARLLETTR